MGENILNNHLNYKIRTSLLNGHQMKEGGVDELRTAVPFQLGWADFPHNVTKTLNPDHLLKQSKNIA